MNRNGIMPGIVPAIVLALAACSSSTGGAPVADTQVHTGELQGPGISYVYTTTEQRDVMKANILAPLDSVWHVLPGVFLELNVDPGTVDQKEHVISNTSFVVHRTLGGVPLSRYLDCGSSVTGAAANEMRVTMSLVVQVVADSAGMSLLRSQVGGTGVAEATVGVKVHCATTGALESRVARMVNDAIARRAKK